MNTLLSSQVSHRDHLLEARPEFRLRALDQGCGCSSQLNGAMWQSIGSILAVPTDRDVRLAVLNNDEVHALVFPCRRRDDFWVDAKSGRIVDVHPTHWQEWSQEFAPTLT